MGWQVVNIGRQFINLISNLNRPAGLIRNLISYLDVNDANNVSDIFAYFVRHMKLISFMFKQGEVGLGQCDLIWQNSATLAKFYKVLANC